jgi:hypothetical protein
MKHAIVVSLLAWLLLTPPALSAECYVCGSGGNSCVPTLPRTGYHVCTIMGPGWCEVSQPCVPYGRSFSAVTRFLPRQLVYGATSPVQSRSCIFDYMATKRPPSHKVDRTAVG